MKRLMIVIILFNIILVCLDCTRQNYKSECINVNKIDLLLRDIFRKKYMFPFLRNVGDTDIVNYNYLVSKGFVLPSNIYYIKILNIEDSEGIDSIRIIPANPDTLKNKMINTVAVSLKQINADTTNVNIAVGYSNIGKYAITEATFNYTFDSTNCKWILNDSTFWQY
jgi:hypothetical protein